MNKKALMFYMSLSCLVTILFTWAMETQAATIKCSYNQKVLFIEASHRSIGQTRVVGNLSYHIVIKDINNFNVLEDIVTISNKKDQSITHSLKCVK